MTASAEPVLVERDGHVAVITLNRAEHGNALLPEMNNRLAELWTELDADPIVRCIIVTGAGERHFCTGADVSGVADRGGIGLDGTVAEMLRFTSRQAGIWKPVICAVNGTAAGGGLHFVVDADIVVASSTAQFLDSHVNVGMVGAIENIGLAKRLPLGTALRMTLQGRKFRMSAGRAWQLGLVDEVAEPDQLMAVARQIASDICENSPTAVSLSQRAIWESLEIGYRDAMESGWQLARAHWSHPDFAEGPKAFAERRAPKWVPRDWS